MNNDDHFTRNSGALSPELEARVVAWVLGEASAFEAAQLEVLCAQQPELAVFKRRIEAVHGLMGEAAKPSLKTPLRLSPERRAKVLTVIGGAESGTGVPAGQGQPEPATPAMKARKPSKHFAWRSWAMPMAACLTMMVLLSAVIIPTVGKVQKKASRTAELSELRQQEQRRLIEQAAALEAVVDNNVAASNAPLVFFDKDKAAAGSIAGDAPAPASVLAARDTGRIADTTVGSHGARGQASGGFAVGLDAQPKEMAITAKPARNLGTVTITAGVPQEFTELASNETPQLGDQRQAWAMNNDLAGAKQDGFGVSDQSTARLESVASEVRRRRDIRNPAADPFAPVAAGVVSGTGVELDEKAKAQLVSKGRSQYLAGDMSGAQETFRTLEAAAPENKEASVFLARIEKEKSAVGELNRVKAHSQMMEEVANSWQRPGVHVAGKDSNEAVASAPMKTVDPVELTRQKINDIIIPQVSFKDVPLSRVVATLTSISDEYDHAEGDRSGANIILMDPTNKDPHVSITLRNLSVRRMLDLITDSTGYRYEIHDKVIVVRPGEDTEVAKPKPASPAFDESLRAEIPTATEAISTFSLHVSDASFRLAKAALERGQAPDPATVRPEEFYNAFDYGDPSPVAGEPVSCRIEQAAHPFMQQRNLVRIAMKVPAAGRGAGQPLRLTVLLDTSGSMEREDRAATVRAALTALTSLLGPNDRVTLIGFARTPRLLAESVPGDQAGKLVELAARTPSEGGTNLEEALALAGKLAMRQKLATAQNRIVVLTDGAANLGDADPQALAKRVEALRQNGIAFDACGVVADGLDDSVLEALTRKGDGRYAVLNSPEEADAQFARQLAGAFRPAAKDVKVQVRFNPARVARYRLIGFEKHRLKTEDFRNDAVDAAELAAEEAAVALYQVEVRPEGEGELGEVSVRFLDTGSGQRVERAWTLGYAAQAPAFARATPSLQLAGASAFLAEKLRGGALAGQVRLDEFAPVVEGLGAAYPQAERVREFITMFRQARRVTGE